MSDITGPPVQRPAQPVSHGTDKATGVSRDRQQTSGRDHPEEKQENKAKPDKKDTSDVRDPAVSIAPSAAHLRIGEELEHKVKNIDVEGRPIIVTETATFALRPDAGLRPGDDVKLEVKEASKTLTADLLSKNGDTIDPPIRLLLTVIAVHTLNDTVTDRNTIPVQEQLTSAYKPTVNQPEISSTTQTVSDTAMLAHILGRTHTEPSTIIAKGNNPDHIARSSSADLATLISTQQVQSPALSTSTRLDTQVPVDPAQQTQQSRLISETELTRLETPTAAGIMSTGLGPTISAATPKGMMVHIQLMDPAISKVSPAEVAEVLNIKPLSVTEARTLPVNLNTLQAPEGLAQIETNKGNFLLSQKQADTLQGGLVRITNTATEPTQQVNTANINTYSAKLYGGSETGPRSIQVYFPDTAETPASTGSQTTQVSSVHITRGFLTAEGPKNDLRLETALGSIALTLDNTLRPQAGDNITILPPKTELPSASISTPVISAETTAATASLTNSSWPAFHDAHSLVVAESPTLASQMSAQTAQGGPKLLNSMMFLFTALQGRNNTSAINQQTEKLLSDKAPKLLNILKNEFAQLLSPPDSTSEWRSLLVPFDTRGGETSMLAFLFGQGNIIDPDGHKHQSNDDIEREENKKFVVEVEFTVLGPVQLNGLISGNRFDLSLHSHTELSAGLQQSGQELFDTSLAANGFRGRLTFVTTDTFPVNVAEVINRS